MPVARVYDCTAASRSVELPPVSRFDPSDSRWYPDALVYARSLARRSHYTGHTWVHIREQSVFSIEGCGSRGIGTATYHAASLTRGERIHRAGGDGDTRPAGAGRSMENNACRGPGQSGAYHRFCASDGHTGRAGNAQDWRILSSHRPGNPRRGWSDRQLHRGVTRCHVHDRADDNVAGNIGSCTTRYRNGQV